MTEPDYKRPFAQADFRGYFRWNKELTQKLGGYLYHACHEDELRKILDEGKLGLRSKWSLRLPKHGLCTAPGTWTGLNDYQRGNRYGPLLIKFQLNVLNGRHFMVFRREDETRKRCFFVQYEARIPVYSFEPPASQGQTKEPVLWRRVKADASFDESSGGLSLKAGAIYDIVITHPIPLDGCSISGVKHPICIPGKCDGIDLMKSRKLAREIAVEQFHIWMKKNDEFRRFLDRFPGASGASINLK